MFSDVALPPKEAASPGGGPAWPATAASGRGEAGASGCARCSCRRRRRRRRAPPPSAAQTPARAYPAAVCIVHAQHARRRWAVPALLGPRTGAGAADPGLVGPLRRTGVCVVRLNEQPRVRLELGVALLEGRRLTLEADGLDQVGAAVAVRVEDGLRARADPGRPLEHHFPSGAALRRVPGEDERGGERAALWPPGLREICSWALLKLKRTAELRTCGIRSEQRPTQTARGRK